MASTAAQEHPCAEARRIHAPNLLSPVRHPRLVAPASLGGRPFTSTRHGILRETRRLPCRQASAPACAGWRRQEPARTLAGRRHQRKLRRRPQKARTWRVTPPSLNFNGRRRHVLKAQRRPRSHHSSGRAGADIEVHPCARHSRIVRLTAAGAHVHRLARSTPYRLGGPGGAAPFAPRWGDASPQTPHLFTRLKALRRLPPARTAFQPTYGCQGYASPGVEIEMP